MLLFFWTSDVIASQLLMSLCATAAATQRSLLSEWRTPVSSALFSAWTRTKIDVFSPLNANKWTQPLNILIVVLEPLSSRCSIQLLAAFRWKVGSWRRLGEKIEMKMSPFWARLQAKGDRGKIYATTWCVFCSVCRAEWFWDNRCYDGMVGVLWAELTQQLVGIVKALNTHTHTQTVTGMFACENKHIVVHPVPSDLDFTYSEIEYEWLRTCLK